ncbi:hypothetical protein [Pseudoalteromonas luteoviolacea]|uniref:hypothetical protein n=1 Tax=Pseudoalteromonas luteoviolacea TaxID=43657 RepID=UPI001154EE4D|nr:hypothetical protein [Pseudoalteromonas luteoviolacea]TQF71281.1 hypothetical protein FLM44_09365 [Pseudoalteromonas luteoviolacea]
MQNEKVLILGNGLINKDVRHQIDDFDRVVRFNFCAGLPTHLGTKCTDLWLSSRGKQAKKIASDFPSIDTNSLQQVVLTEPAPHRVKQNLFKLIKRKGKIDYSDEIISHIENKNIVTRLEEPYRRAVLADLLQLGRPEYKPVCPSSGMLAIIYFIKKYQKVTIAGFGFQGWKRHPWGLEKKKVNELVRQGKLSWLDAS